MGFAQDKCYSFGRDLELLHAACCLSMTRERATLVALNVAMIPDSSVCRLQLGRINVFSSSLIRVDRFTLWPSINVCIST